ncbi:SDR family NAD(P)-dependent oxidoreductase [candidate division KSB1 bacterium]|nr:SDR family NAD(P)-dependent oxidoreductase [candidate division KSB1 bacterium]NIR68649.1 SDR family NAD(P)-dependent oxidoreductase [candidate division KSB1 bacterium]NIS27138.1 SDR family NAD(P)-dependent oxidoreductase [candidate division KSB1 bacterium]NIT74024.1 SDR family NAD(P)-dependent oxidoreductase [candidate division KSB1 bacterium]NIU27890.1 SDR family NAD(P)-dependent oxidoreductase [candidate division KSB1 bacterium]
MNLSNKIAVVTGAGKGIGRATAMALAKEGANLVIISRTMSDLQSLAREIGNVGRKVLPIQADLTRESEIKGVIQESVSKFGGVDVLVNNAGIGRFARVEELSTLDWDDMFEINLRAMFICTREALPQLKRKDESFVINVASLAGKNAFSGGAGYAASKWGVLALSKCLMLEERDAGVRVLAICPGSVDTHFFHHPSLPKPNREKVLKPEDVAQTIVDAIRLPQRAMVSEIDIRPSNPK